MNKHFTKLSDKDTKELTLIFNPRFLKKYKIKEIE